MHAHAHLDPIDCLVLSREPHATTNIAANLIAPSSKRHARDAHGIPCTVTGIYRMSPSSVYQTYSNSGDLVTEGKDFDELLEVHWRPCPPGTFR